jgi:hypothetical protein
LTDGVVVPFLFSAASPEIAPGDVGSSHNEVQRENWNRLCREVDGLYCLRLDWNDDLNRQKLRQLLSRRFHTRVQALGSGEGENFARAFGLDSTKVEPLLAQLREMDGVCSNYLRETSQHVTRDRIYRDFVVVEGSDPEEGRFDPNKPFVAELKQMVDLIYATNLADALGRYPLTPVDSAGRPVLQELTAVAQTHSTDSSELWQLVKSLEFDLIQRDLFLSSYGLLKLDDVIALRSDVDRAVWRPYIEASARCWRRPNLVIPAISPTFTRDMSNSPVTPESLPQDAAAGGLGAACQAGIGGCGNGCTASVLAQQKRGFSYDRARRHPCGSSTGSTGGRPFGNSRARQTDWRSRRR